MEEGVVRNHKVAGYSFLKLNTTKCYDITSQLSSTGLKPGQVNWVILIMFCPEQVEYAYA